MFFDAAMMARAQAEVERLLLGAKVREPLQLRHDEMCLTFGRTLPAAGLILSSSPESGRVCFESPPKTDFAPQPYGLALRKHLRGARLRAVTQPGFDRLLRLDFEECQGFGRESCRTLVVEVMGKHGNQMLLDEGGRIVSCAKHVPGRLNRYREIMEGEPYVPPPQFGKLDPRTITAELLAERAEQSPDGDLRDLLVAHCLGASRVFTAEVLARMEAAATPVGTLAPEMLSRLAHTLRDLAHEAAADGPVYVYAPPRAADLPAEFAYPVRLCCCGEPVGSETHLGAALGGLLAGEVWDRRMRELRQRLRGAAERRLRSLERRLTVWRARLAKAQEAERDRVIGELLLAQPHAARPRDEEVELVDYYAEGAPTITVKLDPPGDLQTSARRRFERYKRARRVQTRVPPLVEQAEEESEYLGSVLAETDLAEDLEGLGAVEEELTAQGYLRPPQRADRSRRQPSRISPRTTTSADGYTVLYGTNHLQNEELLRLAAPDDLWLHVQGAPGAHVLIRAEGQPHRVPPSTLAEAARLAAWWSRSRNQGVVDVDYTPAKYVRKAKGGRPGMAYYTHQKTVAVDVRRDTARGQ